MSRLLAPLARAADWMDDRDRDLFRVVAAGRNRVLDAVLPPLALGGDDAAIWVPLAVLLGLVSGASRRLAARGLGGFVAASLLTELGLKRLTRRPRPPLAELLAGLGRPPLRAAQPASTSFPSGHAAAGVAFAVAGAQQVGWPAAPLGVLAAAIC